MLKSPGSVVMHHSNPEYSVNNQYFSSTPGKNNANKTAVEMYNSQGKYNNSEYASHYSNRRDTNNADGVP